MGSIVVSIIYRVFFPEVPFINRMVYAFAICLALAILVSLQQKPKPSTIDVAGIDYSTSAGFNAASIVIVAILTALYWIWW